MGTEIERKFLVVEERWSPGDEGIEYRQGYLCLDPARTVRVRTAGDKGWITIKGNAVDLARPEFEYEIPLTDAEELFGLCEGALIEKRRFRVPCGAHVWEVDVFQGDNLGLVVAEIELGRADEPFERPDWVGREVSDEPRYLNSRLVRNPFRDW